MSEFVYNVTAPPNVTILESEMDQNEVKDSGGICVKETKETH